MNEIRAFPITLLQTAEPLRAVRELADRWGDKATILVWDILAGTREYSEWARGQSGRSGLRVGGDPLQALSALHEAQAPVILIALNYHVTFKNPPVIQGLLDGCRAWSRDTRRLVIVAPPGTSLPVEVERYVVILDHDLPDEQALAGLVAANAEANGLSVTDEDVAALARLGRGLTSYEFTNAIALSIAEHGEIRRDEVAEQKAQLVKKNAVLEWSRADWTFAEVGGLDRVKAFIEAVALNPLSRGVLFLGVPGVGKTMVAKALANEVGLPALQLQFSQVFGSLVGESEQKMHSALKVVEAMAPCVLIIDEIEKGLSGVSSSHRSDGGTAARVGESFLTWLNDRPAQGVFVVATCLSEDTVLVSGDGVIAPAKDTLDKADAELWSVARDGDVFAERPSWHIRRRAHNAWLVRTSSSRLECTDDHVFYRYAHNGLEEVQARDLRPGDFIAGPMELPHGIQEIDLDLAYLVGYTSGDGNLQQHPNCVGYNRVQWAEADRDHVNYLATLSEQVLGKKAGVTWRSKSNGAVIYVDDREAVGTLAQNFPELTRRKRLRCVPERICHAADEAVAAFLSGLFDADGTVGETRGVSFTTINKILAHQVVLLLQRLGLLATMGDYAKKPNRVYTVTLSGRQAVRFVEQIGFRMKRKQENALRCVREGNRSGYTVDCVPIDWDAVYALDAPAVKRFWGSNRPRTKQRHRFLETVQQLQSEGVDTSSIDWMLAYRWHRVKDSKSMDGELDVFDVHMPTEHNFVAAGVMAHNCNDISKLPPEFIRAERWDAIFFFDLPTQAERDIIAGLYAGEYDMPLAPRPDEHGWTGAEIKTAYRIARMLETGAAEAAQFVVPLYKTMKEQLTNLREWAQGRCVPASVDEKTSADVETVRRLEDW